jgi:hypothetical protein
VVTDPGDATSRRTLTADALAEYRRLAKGVLDEPARPPTYSCTDRNEVLRVDSHVVSDSCPIAQPGAARLIARLGHEIP